MGVLRPPGLPLHRRQLLRAGAHQEAPARRGRGRPDPQHPDLQREEGLGPRRLLLLRDALGARRPLRGPAHDPAFRARADARSRRQLQAAGQGPPRHQQAGLRVRAAHGFLQGSEGGLHQVQGLHAPAPDLQQRRQEGRRRCADQGRALRPQRGAAVPGAHAGRLRRAQEAAPQGDPRAQREVPGDALQVGRLRQQALPAQHRGLLLRHPHAHPEGAQAGHHAEDRARDGLQAGQPLEEGLQGLLLQHPRVHRGPRARRRLPQGAGGRAARALPPGRAQARLQPHALCGHAHAEHAQRATVELRAAHALTRCNEWPSSFARPVF
mmetsp:Transcript_44996/g.90810  ORF Transcript_44996/g.90810 Transcript_44996/m.90810 type:complete len:324 (+) Transcript_44996:116-1087(+)